MQMVNFNTEIKSMNILLTVSVNCISNLFSVKFFQKNLSNPPKIQCNK